MRQQAYAIKTNKQGGTSPTKVTVPPSLLKDIIAPG